MRGVIQKVAVFGACAGVLLLVPPTPGGWELALPPPSWLSAGGVGHLLWASVAWAWGAAGLAAYRAAWGLLLVALLRRGPSEEGHPPWWLPVAACLLLPWGPAAASPALAMACWAASQSRRPAPVTALLLALWPALDPSFWLWLPCIPWPGSGWRRWGPAAGLLINPCLWGGLVDGSWLQGPRLLAAGSPQWVGPSFQEPSFWVVALLGAWVLGARGLEGEGAPRALLGLLLSWLLRPLAPLVALQGARGRLGGHWSLGAGVLGIGLWAALSGPAPPPAEAVALLRAAPAGNWVVETEAGWSGELRFLFAKGGRRDFRVVPEREPAPRLEWVRRSHGSPSPPFLGQGAPAADFVLMGSYEPEHPDPSAMADGWVLLGAYPQSLLFARAQGPLSVWATANALRAYAPYGELPQDAPGRAQALQEAVALAARSPGFFAAERDAGRLLIDAGQLPEAEGHLRRALALRPAEPQIWNDLGVALSGTGRLQEAEGAFRKAIALNPAEVMPRLNLASVLLAAGRPADARQVLSEVLGMAPGLPVALEMLREAEGVPRSRGPGGAP